MQAFSENSSLTHLNDRHEARMVDISDKQTTRREAEARGQIRLNQRTFEAILAGDTPKGDVLGTARLAGIMGAKQTAQLIPLCHPLPLSKIEVEIKPIAELPGYEVIAIVKTEGKTGVEMEALTAVSISALTLYDMAKALDKEMIIENIRLVRKTGGKSDI